ncbi:uncharacterized protein BDR25DRAFT_307148 [Lindgomyces ingoldianus]|uniref:Uncharacterized protein n=1 Tax=Lindgomyces ingoldianus TaxID=673940 RepID=A0ACB6QC75_9PLEO|nr:uncharacterized protein BDR25DRAFT_307148 [Lindgomyces ingoldianus]KAF2464639.1 hypothetical protein BDR25DRAFT_307148 [Lindgomyces ingoldianus]
MALLSPLTLLQTLLLFTFSPPTLSQKSSPPPSITVPIFHLPVIQPSGPNFSGNRTWHGSIIAVNVSASLTTIAITSTYEVHISPYYHGQSAKSTYALTTGTPETITQGVRRWEKTVMFGNGSDVVSCGLEGVTAAECTTRYFGAVSGTGSVDAVQTGTERWNASASSGWGWANVTVTGGVEKLGTAVPVQPSGSGMGGWESPLAARWRVWMLGLSVVGSCFM